MGDFDPVSWEAIEAATGLPAAEIEEYVERMQGDVRDEDPYTAVKTVHDALSEDLGEDRRVPGVGEVFITAYLLERRGIVTAHPDDADGSEGAGDPEREYRSLVDRRPGSERLRELFWERERTLWWIGILVGVHPSLVTYWLYEDDIPLMERNLSDESMARIRAYRDAENA